MCTRGIALAETNAETQDSTSAGSLEKALEKGPDYEIDQPVTVGGIYSVATMILHYPIP
jgi:hypothetical protein